MARYRHKSDEDLAWNRIRRRITQELDCEIKNAREEALNSLLSQAWTDYTKALGKGTVPEVESKYSNLAHAVVQDVIQIPEMVDGDAAVA
ncbi:MAG: hypothetical protein ACXVHX_22755 [Solirubrobacteraceae bacterium]